MFVMVAIAIIVGLVLLQPSASNVAKATQTYFRNSTFTAPAVNGTIDLVGQELISTPLVINATSNTVISSGNYTIGERVSPTDGLKRIYFKTLDGATVTGFNGKGVNISYTYGDEGYIDDGAGRSIAGLIIILASLALAVVVMFKIYEDGSGVFS